MQCSKFALFLGDLSMHCNEADLEEAFAPYGTILEIRVKRSKETAKTLSYGFLEFASASSAVNAMNDMDGAVLKGRPLRIRWAASKKNPVRKRDIREDLSDRISMHVKFMSYKIEKVITEELLRNLFSIYGEVSDTTIKQISIDRKSHRLKGYGFVSYFNDEAGYLAAQRALTELHDTTLDDITYKCELSNIIDSAAPLQGQGMPPGSPYLAPGMGVNMHGAPVLGLTPQSSSEFDFESAAQSSYYDDYSGNPEALYANGLDIAFEKSNSGGAMTMRESSATTNASMSSSSSKFPSRSSSLEKDGLSPGALDFRTPLMVEEAPRQHFAPANAMNTFGRSPGRAAISASPLLSSYQTVGAPLSGGPVGGPRPAPVQRPYHYNQVPPQQQGQYPSQSRYQPNREPGYPSPQMSHLGVASGALYDSSPSGTRRSLPGSPQMSPPVYWQNNTQGQGMQPRGPYSPTMSQGSPRGMPPSFAQKYDHPPQHGAQGVYGAPPPPPQQQGQARYSPQQHYAPHSRVQTQGLTQNPNQGLALQPPVYPRYSPPTQYGQLALSPSHLQQVQNQQQGSGQGQGSPHGSHSRGPGSPYFPPHSPSQQQQLHAQGQGLSHHAHHHQNQAQGQAQGQAYAPQGQNQSQGQGYNPQSREFHPQNNSYERHHAQNYNNTSSNHTSTNHNQSNARPAYNDFSLDLALSEPNAPNNNNNREGLIREDYFGASNNNTSNGWFPPTDLPQM